MQVDLYLLKKLFVHFLPVEVCLQREYYCQHESLLKYPSFP